MTNTPVTGTLQRLVLIGLAGLVLAACAQPAGPAAPPRPAGPIRIDPTDARNLTGKPNMSDYLRLAQGITEQMLSSEVIVGRATPPRLVLNERSAQSFNDTSDEEIEVREIFETITQTIVSSTAARYVDASSNAFDFVVFPRLTESVQTAPGQPVQRIYRMCLTLNDLKGEQLGQWCDLLGFEG